MSRALSSTTCALLALAMMAPGAATADHLVPATTHVGACPNGWRVSPHAHYRSFQVQSSVRLVTVAEAGDTGVKSFFPQPAVEQVRMAGVTLSRVGILLMHTGHHVCTGELSFDGGPHARLLGAHVRIRVRGYAGTPQHAGNLDGMALLFETQQRVWIPRGVSKAVSLVPVAAALPRTGGPRASIYRLGDSVPAARRGLAHLIDQQFARITHVEVVMDYLHQP